MKGSVRTAVILLVSALVLPRLHAAPAGKAAPEAKEGPRMVGMSGEEVVERLASFAREAAKRNAPATTAAALRALQERQMKRFKAAPACDASKTAAWLAAADEEAVADAFRASPLLMAEVSEALAVDFLGITIRYIVDANGTEGNVLECPDLDAAIAQLFHYPWDVLVYLGHNDSPLVVDLHAEGLNPCDGASGCACASHIWIGAGGTGSLVHEVGHAIESLMLARNVDDPDNPLAGLHDEFLSVFNTPPEDGWIPYAEQDSDTPLYAGFPTYYSLQSMTENFAETCAYYVDEGNEFQGRARRQAREGEGLLYHKYLFAYRHVFRRISYAASPPEEKALVWLSAVDRGNGDGRAEPGEAFSLAMEIMPVETLAGAVELRCVPDPADAAVASRADSVRVWSPQAWRLYRYEAVGDYTVSPALDRDRNYPFAIESRTAAGAAQRLAVETLPLNESGWLWAYCWDESDGAILVKISSTLKEIERVALPGALDEFVYGNWKLYDPTHDCFWFIPLDPRASLAWFRRGDAEHAARVPLDPDGRFRGDRTPPPLYNRADGSIWLTGEQNTAMRLSLDADGTVGRRYVDLTGGGAIPRYGSRGMSFCPRSGKFWTAGYETFHRYSALGAIEAWYGGVESIDGVAAAADGGCWLTEGMGLYRSSPLGALQPRRALEFAAEGPRCHPESGALWSLGTVRLTLFSENGEPQHEWDLGADGYNLMPRLIPSSSDGSIFLCYQHDYEAGLNPIERCRPDGSRERAELALPDCAYLGFQTVGDIHVRQGGADIFPGGAYDFGNVPVAGPGALADFSIQNTGTLALELKDWTVGGENADRFSIAWPPHPRIAPGAAMTMTLCFIPGSAGVKTAQVSIQSNDPGESPYVFTVRGRGTVPDINLKSGTKSLPSGTGSYNFGTLTLPSATRPEAVFTVENTGLAVLTLDSWTIAGTNASQFRITQAPARSILGKPAATMKVQFNPTTAGTKRATLSIRSNDPDENPYTISLAGTCAVSKATPTPTPKPGLILTPKP